MKAPSPARALRILAAVGAGAAFGILAGLGVRRVRALDLHVYPHTASGPAFVYTVCDEQGEPVRVLRAGGGYQSAVRLTREGTRAEGLPFAYLRTFDRIFEPHAHGAPPASRVLAIGGGGCAWPVHAALSHPELSLDIVEMDPAMARIARERFFLDDAVAASGTAPNGDARLRVHIAEGRAFLECCPAGSFDAIANDTFTGTRPARALATVEAARAAKRALKEHGALYSNVSSSNGGRDLAFLRAFAASCREVFAHVHVIPCEDEEFSGEDNYLLIATDGPWRYEGALPLPPEFFGEALRD